LVDWRETQSHRIHPPGLLMLKKGFETSSKKHFGFLKGLFQKGKVYLFGKEIEDFGDFIDIVLICCDKNIMNSIHHDRNLLHDDEIGKVTIKRFYNEQNIDGTSDCIMCIDYGDELESMRNQLSRYSVGETLNEKSV